MLSDITRQAINARPPAAMAIFTVDVEMAGKDFGKGW
jgi:hypothetical protein